MSLKRKNRLTRIRYTLEDAEVQLDLAAFTGKSVGLGSTIVTLVRTGQGPALRTLNKGRYLYLLIRAARNRKLAVIDLDGKTDETAWDHGSRYGHDIGEGWGYGYGRRFFGSGSGDDPGSGYGSGTGWENGFGVGDGDGNGSEATCDYLLYLENTHA